MKIMHSVLPIILGFSSFSALAKEHSYFQTAARCKIKNEQSFYKEIIYMVDKSHGVKGNGYLVFPTQQLTILNPDGDIGYNSAEKIREYPFNLATSFNAFVQLDSSSPPDLTKDLVSFSTPDNKAIAKLRFRDKQGSLSEIGKPEEKLVQTVTLKNINETAECTVNYAALTPTNK